MKKIVKYTYLTPVAQCEGIAISEEEYEKFVHNMVNDEHMKSYNFDVHCGTFSHNSNYYSVTTEINTAIYDFGGKEMDICITKKTIKIYSKDEED